MTETHFDANAALKLGQDVLSHEADAILAASRRIGETPDFAQAVKAILGCRGRLVVSGVGKSGHIGRKLAATFASTGTPAFFVHAGEAAHGDLGMITSEDIVLGISYSGETQELLMIVPILKREGAILIAMTGNPESTLAHQLSCRSRSLSAQSGSNQFDDDNPRSWRCASRSLPVRQRFQSGRFCP